MGKGTTRDQLSRVAAVLDEVAEDLALLLLNRPEDAVGVAFTHKWYDHNKVQTC